MAMALTGSGDACLWTVSHSCSIIDHGSSKRQYLLESASTFTTALSASHSCTAPPASTPPAAGPFPAASFSSKPTTATHSAIQPTPPTPQSSSCCTHQLRHGPTAPYTSGHSFWKPIFFSALSINSTPRFEGEKEALAYFLLLSLWYCFLSMFWYHHQRTVLIMYRLDKLKEKLWQIGC